MSRLSLALKTIERYARIFKNQRLDELGLVRRQSEILYALRRRPGVSQDEIAEELLINKSGVTRQLTAMEEAGLVTRSVSPADRRVTQVYLTEKAVALLPEIHRINEEWSEFITEGLSEEEQELLTRVLESVSARIHECMERGDTP